MNTETNKLEGRPTRVLYAPVDIFENDNGLHLRADLPGVTQEALEIRLHEGQLDIVGRRPLNPGRGEGFIEYRRRFQVPRHVDGSKVTARLDRGVLLVDLPKADAARPRVIPIQNG
ncbi:MAG: Hsp20/alpha crystallin family protein [Myxococcales bacterium]|nr:Hsp20/alpha crystallin family protein [Myxococcales bacterium]